MNILKRATVCVVAGLMASSVQAGHLERVVVTVENLSSEGGVYLTPVWLGFHDGTFDVFSMGESVSPGLEQLAEDGATGGLSAEFQSAMPNGLDDTLVEPSGFVGAPVYDPGSKAGMVYALDASGQRYFSFASMVIPSNDAFVSNDNPMAYELFDDQGNFTGPITIMVMGNQVWDAGSEVNSEIPADVAFLGQAAPNTGADESSTVQLHAGYNGSVGNPSGTPVGILGSFNAAGSRMDEQRADFTTDNYPLLRISIVQRPSVSLRVQVENLMPDNGLYLTPFWLGFHNGDFDIFNFGEAASPGLESLAEDGSTAAISEELTTQVMNTTDITLTDPDGFVGAPVFEPGNSETVIVEVDPLGGSYFSYASMVIPSNDAFIANEDPMAHRIFNSLGQYTGDVSFTVYGRQITDAGTEMNTEMDAAFLNQSAPNTGASEGGGVEFHSGFNGSRANPGVQPMNILGGTTAAGTTVDADTADFTAQNTAVAKISVSYALNGSFSGSWFDPLRNGEGFLIEASFNEEPVLVVSWYTYAPDGSGDQVWLFGSGPIVGGSSASVELFSTEGGAFGDAFNSDDVNMTPWGTVDFEFDLDNCTQIDVNYTSTQEGYGSGSRSLQRLTPALLGGTDFCTL